MALRTTAQLVKGILLSDYGPTRDGNLPSLDPFIATANSMVNQLVRCAANKGVTLDDEDLELVERWLAAHCYVMTDQPYEEETAGKSRAIYQGGTNLDKGLELSKYGQVALSLDYTGCLKAISKGARASITWLGKPPSQQIPYHLRD